MPEVKKDEETDKYVDRRWSIPAALWEQILESASATGINYAELVCMFLESGLAVHLGQEIERARPAPPPPPRTTVYVEKGDTTLGRLAMLQVPPAGEYLTVDGKNYVIRQRAWSVSKGEVSAFLRVDDLEAA